MSSCFTSFGDILLALSIFDPRKLPSVDSEDLSCYAETSIKTLLEHYGAEKSAETLQGETKVKEPMISSNVTTEWKTLSVHGQAAQNQHKATSERVEYKQNTYSNVSKPKYTG